MTKAKKKQKLLSKEELISWLTVTIGAIVAAFALEEFLAPNNIFDGGITGVSMILVHFIPLKLGVMVIICNLPFLIFGWFKMGHRFIIKVVYSIGLFSIMTSVFEPMAEMTDEILLAVTFGGVLLGAGVGMVLRGGGCLDGTEIVAVYLGRRVSFSVGQIILIVNVVIYTVAGFVFGANQGMYSLLMYFITSKIIDIVEVGMDTTKSVMIISDNGRELADEIFEKLGRTVTFLRGEGYISSEKKDILYCVITRGEMYDLKQILNESEGSTFTTVSEVSDIVGNHIKS